MFAKGGLLTATALTGVLGASLVAAPGARAQSADTQINSIERQIHALQSQLSGMKHSLAKRDAEIRAAREEAAAANRQALAISQRTTNGFGQPMAPQPLSAPPGYQVNLGRPGVIPKYGPYVYVGGVPTPVLYPGPPLKPGQFQVGAVRVTLGGFVEAAGIFRSRNETADISSSFNGIPYANSPNYHTPEFRESDHQSRLSILAEANADDVTKLSFYYELDFQSAGASSNSAESNSYTLRQRQIFATYARSDWDFYMLGGQAWSLATMYKTGLTPRKEDAPLTIDASYVPGFVWTRNTQLRFVKGFNHDMFDLGVSFESPEVNYYTGGNGTGSLNGTVLSTNAGGSGLNATANYSIDVAPDVIVKGTADPGWGHYELFGLARFPHDRTTLAYPGNNGRNNTVLAGGGGAGMILPLISHNRLDFQASGLVGEGIGRYGASQLPDATFSQNGSLVPLPEVEALIGLTSDINKAIQLYGYVGTEQITQRKAFTERGKPYGYGSPLYSNAGCNIEQPATSSLASPCVANTSGIVQGTVGAWWKFLKGDFGTMQTGVQYSYTRKNAFQGTGGAPKTDDNMVFFSFRYYPFD